MDYGDAGGSTAGKESVVPAPMSTRTAQMVATRQWAEVLDDYLWLLRQY